MGMLNTGNGSRPNSFREADILEESSPSEFLMNGALGDDVPNTSRKLVVIFDRCGSGTSSNLYSTDGFQEVSFDGMVWSPLGRRIQK